jgi:hypothetical protein
MLIVIALLLGAILAAIILNGIAITDYLHRHLQVVEMQRRYLTDLLGHEQDGDAAILIACALDFYRKALNGRIPSLRLDDWKPSVLDRDRIRKAAMAREEEDRYLG